MENVLIKFQLVNTFWDLNEHFIVIFRENLSFSLFKGEQEMSMEELDLIGLVEKMSNVWDHVDI